MLSNTITSNDSYKSYLSRFLVPPTAGSLDGAKSNFVRSILGREATNHGYLARYLNAFDLNFSLTAVADVDRLAQIEIALKRLAIHEIVEILAFSSTRNLGMAFFSTVSNFDAADFEAKLNALYFDNNNKWEIGTSNPVSLLTVLENDEGVLLLLAKRGEEVKYINERQEYVNQRKSAFFNVYVSKRQKILSISGVVQRREMEVISEFLLNKLGIEVDNRMPFLGYHFEIFETKANSISRRGELEIAGRNEIQNNSSRNTVSSDLKYKVFLGDTNTIGGFVDISDGMKDINLGFDTNKQLLSIAKNSILPNQYIHIIEYFLSEIYFGTPSERSLPELFKYKFSRQELIPITADVFSDSAEVKKMEFEAMYGVTFVSCCGFRCVCGAQNRIEKPNIGNPSFKCDGCSRNHGDIENIEVNSYYLDFDETFYAGLFHGNFDDKFNDKGAPIKVADFQKVIDGEERTFRIVYGNEERKRGIVHNSDSNLIYIFISPSVMTAESDDIFKVQSREHRSVFCYFNLDVFSIIKDDEKRNVLFSSIFEHLKNTGMQPIQYNFFLSQGDLNTGDNFHAAVTNSQIRSTQATQTN